MSRTLIVVLALVVVAVVLLVNLTILDVFTVEEMRETTGDLVAVGAVTAGGVVVLGLLLRLLRSSSGPSDREGP